MFQLCPLSTEERNRKDDGFPTQFFWYKVNGEPVVDHIGVMVREGMNILHVN